MLIKSFKKFENVSFIDFTSVPLKVKKYLDKLDISGLNKVKNNVKSYFTVKDYDRVIDYIDWKISELRDNKLKYLLEFKRF
jgi:6-pyruvoyl-tetrahydropterin synthase